MLHARIHHGFASVVPDHEVESELQPELSVIEATARSWIIGATPSCRLQFDSRPAEDVPRYRARRGESQSSACMERFRVCAGESISTCTRERRACAFILPGSRSRAFAAAFTAEKALVNVNVNVNAERTFTFAPTMPGRGGGEDPRAQRDRCEREEVGTSRRASRGVV